MLFRSTLGIDPARDKVAMIQIGAQPDRLTAVVSGRVDATALEPGFGQVAKDKGLTMLTDLTKTETPYVNTVIVGLRRYVKENPQLMETFLKGIVDCLAMMPNRANEKAVKSVLAKRLRLTPESTQAIYESTLQIHTKTRAPYAPIAGVQNMIDVLQRVNPKLAKLKAAEIVDNSFVEALDKSGYVSEAFKRSR